jgi:hypothetical protein
MKIRIPCQGGLGNQLFIWVAAHELSKKYEVPVEITYLDTSTSVTSRELYPLQDFCEHRIYITESRSFGRCLDWYDRITNKFKSTLEISDYLGILDDYKNPFLPPEYKVKKPKWVRGYFQNNQLIENNLEPVEEIKALLSRQSRKYNTTNQIAIHVRRGDYKLSADFYGILTKGYYKKIIGTENEYIVFSEKLDYVKEFMSDKNLRIILDDTSGTVWETLAMMSDALEIHMANSTLSWWGGKLSEDKKRRITMPRPWFKCEYDKQELIVSNRFELVDSDYETNDY